MFKPAVRQAGKGLRSYSSQAEKAQSMLVSVSQKGSNLVKTGIFYSKVVGELARYVWLKEGLYPPSVAEFQKAYTVGLQQLWQTALKEAKNPSKLVEQAKSYSGNDYTRFAAVGVQFLGIFALGEMIGRRHVYGYKDHKHE